MINLLRNKISMGTELTLVDVCEIIDVFDNGDSFRCKTIEDSSITLPVFFVPSENDFYEDQGPEIYKDEPNYTKLPGFDELYPGHDYEISVFLIKDVRMAYLIHSGKSFIDPETLANAVIFYLVYDTYIDINISPVTKPLADNWTKFSFAEILDVYPKLTKYDQFWLILNRTDDIDLDRKLLKGISYNQFASPVIPFDSHISWDFEYTYFYSHNGAFPDEAFAKDMILQETGSLQSEEDERANKILTHFLNGRELNYVIDAQRERHPKLQHTLVSLEMACKEYCSSEDDGKWLPSLYYIPDTP